MWSALARKLSRWRLFRWRAAVIFVALLVGLSACQVDIEVGIGFNEDGSGVVTVDVALDEQAMSLYPDISSQLLTGDIEDPASGWTYSEPRIDEQGRTSFTASKSFGSPEQLELVLGELFSGDNVFQDFTFERSTSFAKIDYRVTGLIDLSGGLDLIADPELTEQLGGQPFGDATTGAATALEGVTMRVVMDLPVGPEREQVLEIGGDQAVRLEMTASDESNTAVIFRWVAWLAFALMGLAVLIAVAGVLLERRARERNIDPAFPQGSVARTAGAAPAQPPARRLRLVVLNPLGVLFEPSEPPAKLLASYAAARGGRLGHEEVAELHHQAVLGRITSTELWAGLGMEENPAKLTRHFLGQYTVRSGARDFVAEMARRNLPVACLTNDISPWSSALRERLEVVGVSTWIVSSDVGVCMPAPGIYEALRRTTSVPYENSLLVDVVVEHLDAAGALGMSTALFAESRFTEGAAPGHAVVTSFSDFFRRRARA